MAFQKNGFFASGLGALVLWGFAGRKGLRALCYKALRAMWFYVSHVSHVVMAAGVALNFGRRDPGRLAKMLVMLAILFSWLT